MDSANIQKPETNTHSFVIRIWREDDTMAKWRGHITHVPSHKRCHFDNFARISEFMIPYLAELGVRLNSTADR